MSNKIAGRGEIKEIIVKYLTDISERYAGKDHYVETVIEEKEPFFWRINKKWAEELSDEMVEEIVKIKIK